MPTLPWSALAGVLVLLIGLAPTVLAQNQNSSATGAPTISGTTQMDETLTADTSGIADNNGLTNVSYSYQWISNDGDSDTDITGATGSTYTLVSADIDKTIKVRVSFTDDEGFSESLTSAATTTVVGILEGTFTGEPAPVIWNNPATGAPTISGTAQVGQTLTASTSGISDPQGLTNVSYNYQWLADDTDIEGATSSTYTVQTTDNGKVIKVRVTFTDDWDNDESLTSEGTSAVVMGGL